MQKPYLIRVSSTKGGVGKSVISINLAVALQMYGYRTLLVDSDTVNPSIGVYMGLEDVNIGIEQALKHKVALRRAIVPHAASGVHVLPGQVVSGQMMPTAQQMNSLFTQIEKLDYDFVIVDTQPGIQFPESLHHYDEALLISLPDEVSTISVVKMIKQYSRVNLKTSIIVNRVANNRYELSIREIEALCENKVTGILPEDNNVKLSIAEHIPLFLKNTNEKFSKQLGIIGAVYTSRSGVIRAPQTYDTNTGFFASLVDAIRHLFRR